MRILIVRFGRAGDMVMTTPAIKALIECLPDGRFTLLTSPDGKRLLRDFSPRIDDTWVWNRSRLGASLQKLKLKKKLASNPFDKIVCFETRPSLLKLFEGLGADFYWCDSFDLVKHSARHYLDLAEKVCNTSLDDIAVNLPVKTDASRALDDELEHIGIHTGDTVIALHPTFSGYSRFSLRKRGARLHKLWPAEKFARLAQRLSETRLADERPPVVIMDLLDDELALGNSIVSLSNDSIKLLNVKPNFDRYKALLQRADLLVSPDTGPMHIAAAVGTRIVALFSGKDPALCGPFTDPDLFTVLNPPKDAAQQVGIAGISVEQVYDACLQQLARLPSSPSQASALRESR